MHTHHSHSGSYCAHAADTLDGVVARYRQMGFHTVGLSEHCPRRLDRDLYPEEVAAGTTPAALRRTFRAYVAHAWRLQKSSDMSILVGCETEHLGTDSLAFLQNELNALPGAFPSPSGAAADGVPPGAWAGRGAVDYLVGSVHHVHTTPIDFDRPTFEKAVGSAGSYPALTAAYLDAQYEMLRTLRPEVVGHLDLIRLYTPRASFDGVWEKLERNIRYAVAYGALIEINASSVRKGWATPYPGEEILRLILQLGGRVCLSDDSHGLGQVGLNYGPARTYLLEHEAVIWYLSRPDTSVDTPNEPVTEHSEMQVQSRLADGGLSAPTRFPRGLVACPLPAWSEDTFWNQTLPAT